MKMADTILIVDDDEDLRGELRDILEGYDVIEASSGEEVLRVLRRAHEIGLAILDVRMPGISGLDVLSEIKKADPGIRVIILTGHSSKDTAIEALKSRADDYIEKPLNTDKIIEAVERLLGSAGSRPGEDPPGLDGKIEKVRRFIERNCYKKITLADAARAVYMSPKYLSRSFKERMNTGFSDYKLTLKIHAAKKLLRESGYNVNQLSDKLGYKNAESFIRQFKNIVRVTPTEFRRRAQRRGGRHAGRGFRGKNNLRARSGGNVRS